MKIILSHCNSATLVSNSLQVRPENPTKRPKICYSLCPISLRKLFLAETLLLSTLGALAG
jgi:hypothetical protein